MAEAKPFLPEWGKVLEIIDEKLQYGLLEQTRAVVGAEMCGSVLELSVATDEAFQFFSSPVNQQRLIIISRPVLSIGTVVVRKAPRSK